MYVAKGACGYEYCWILRNRVQKRRPKGLPNTTHESSDPPAKHLGVRVQKASWGRLAKPTSSPPNQYPSSNPASWLLTKPLAEQPNESRLLTKPLAEQSSEARPPSNPARRQLTLRKANLVLSSHVDAMRHYQAMLRPRIPADQ
jgi:hypothetical protein